MSELLTGTPESNLDRNGEDQGTHIELSYEIGAIPTDVPGSETPEIEVIPPNLSATPAAERIIQIKMPTRHNDRLALIVNRVNGDQGLYALWRCANVNAVERLGMSDHGPVHVQIVANIGLRLLRLLVSSGLTPNVVKDHAMHSYDAEIITVLACLLHDVGMSIHRDDHERYSLFIAEPKLRVLLAGIYEEPDLTIIVSEVLHAIISHRSGGHPKTIEAGVVRVADALDMAKGRSRIPFEAGQVNIHSVSAAAIDRVLIHRGESKPIRIEIEMSNSAGIFQVDELLKEKLHGSGLEPFLEVAAHIVGETERSLIQLLRL